MDPEGSQQNVPRYRAYMLRVWLEVEGKDEEQGAWRFVLQRPGSANPAQFSSFEQLVNHLRAQLNQMRPG